MLCSLAEKAGTLRLQLGLPDDRTLTETVDEAVTQLGLAKEVAGLPLIQKADACISAMMGSSTVVMGQALEVDQMQIAPQLAVMERRPDDGLVRTDQIEGDWCCVGLGGCARYRMTRLTDDSFRVDGCAGLLYILPTPIDGNNPLMERRRVPGTNRFRAHGPPAVYEFDAGGRSWRSLDWPARAWNVRGQDTGLPD